MMDILQAYDHDKFVSIIQKVRNQDFTTLLLTFMKEDPQNLGKLMRILQSKLDHELHQVRKHKQFAMIMPY